ncbi:hypothetical protein H2248_009061 [Termitomyces sp. 'cryptogamus']|nr:hypothetical protein H2248_009061 [Termitomyces sp. 'cryptogamus']
MINLNSNIGETVTLYTHIEWNNLRRSIQLFETPGRNPPVTNILLPFDTFKRIALSMAYLSAMPASFAGKIAGKTVSAKQGNRKSPSSFNVQTETTAVDNGHAPASGMSPRPFDALGRACIYFIAVACF